MFSMKNKVLMSAAAIGVLSLGAMAGTAHAQAGSSMPPAQQQEQINVSDAQLKEFVEAQAAVNEVQGQFQGRAQSVNTQEEMQALQKQANEKMIEVIEKTDLSVEQYNQIAMAVQADPQVQQKYIELTR